MAWPSLIAVLLTIGLLLTAGLMFLMANTLVHPKRMTDGKAIYLLRRLSPEDLGLPYESVTFKIRDEASGNPLSIAAWWIPAAMPSRNTCIIIHGYGDAKVGGIAWAPALRELGLNLCAIDLRAHGQSGGQYTTGGYYERHDLSQVLDQLQRDRPGAMGHVVLFGISHGAAAALATADMRPDIDAVILESPYVDFKTAAATHAWQMGMPLVSLHGLIGRLAEWISNADFAAVAPVRLIPKVQCPLMLIHSGDDTLIRPKDAESLKDAMGRRPAETALTTYWDVPGAYHVLGIQTAPEEYRARIRAFLTAAKVLE